MVVEKMRKGKRKFERKRKIYELCREEMEVTEEPKIAKMLWLFLRCFSSTSMNFVQSNLENCGCS